MTGKQTEVKRLVTVDTRLAAEQYDRLAALAKINERSVAAELRLAIRAHLAASSEVAA